MPKLPLVQLTKHQEHVIAHVLGCTILGFYQQLGQIHLLLDLPLLWSVDADGAMELAPDEEGIEGMPESPDVIQGLLAEAYHLRHQSPDADSLMYFQEAPEISLISDVTLYQHPNGVKTDKLLVVRGEDGGFEIDLLGSSQIVEINTCP